MDMGVKHIILALGAFGAGIGVTRLLGRRAPAPQGAIPYSQATQDAIAAGEVLGEVQNLPNLAQHPLGAQNVGNQLLGFPFVLHFYS